MHSPTDPRNPAWNPGSGNVDDALRELDREMEELKRKMAALRQPQAPPAAPQPVVPPQPPAPQAQAPVPAPQAPPAQPPAPQPAEYAPAPPPAPPVPAAQPQPPAASRQADWVDATGADLRRLRDNLNRLTKELARAVDDLLSGIETMRGRPEAHVFASQAPAPPAPAPQMPAPPAPTYEIPVLENIVELDVGPFTDLVAVERFKQAVGDLPGVEDVYVKTYGKGRALIELTVDDRQTVVDEMHVHLPYPLDAGPTPDGKVVVHLHAAPAVDQTEA